MGGVWSATRRHPYRMTNTSVAQIQ